MAKSGVSLSDTTRPGYLVDIGFRFQHLNTQTNRPSFKEQLLQFHYAGFEY
jgi:hypothetical protein